MLGFPLYPVYLEAETTVQIFNLGAEISLFKQFVEVEDEKYGKRPNQWSNLRKGSTPQQRPLAFLSQHGCHADLGEGQDKHDKDPGWHLKQWELELKNQLIFVCNILNWDQQKYNEYKRCSKINREKNFLLQRCAPS